MQSNIKISIITPVYNRVGMIGQTIESVLSQSYENVEYIIVDGGSTDGTVDIIREYASTVHSTPYPIHWISEPDNGMYDAISKGFSMATGDVLLWLNSDDMLHPGALQIMADIYAQCPEVEWLTGTPTMYNADGLCCKTFPITYWNAERFRKGDFRWIQQESTSFRRTLWERAGGKLDMNYRLAADFELWCRFFHYAKLYSVNTILGGFRLHGNQLSIGQNDKYESEVSNICTKYNFRSRMTTWHKFMQRLPHRAHYCRVEYDFDKQKWITKEK